ncbi:hypothetical protein [Citrobacter koseri]
MTALLELSNIRRSYPSGEEQVEVLKGISRKFMPEDGSDCRRVRFR